MATTKRIAFPSRRAGGCEHIRLGDSMRASKTECRCSSGTRRTMLMFNELPLYRGSHTRTPRAEQERVAVDRYDARRRPRAAFTLYRCSVQTGMSHSSRVCAWHVLSAMPCKRIDIRTHARTLKHTRTHERHTHTHTNVVRVAVIWLLGDSQCACSVCAGLQERALLCLKSSTHTATVECVRWYWSRASATLQQWRLRLHGNAHTTVHIFFVILVCFVAISLSASIARVCASV